jgi:hypothetical protein
VNAIKTELERTNNTMELMLAEMKRTNSVQEQLVGMPACAMNRRLYLPVLKLFVEKIIK